MEHVSFFLSFTEDASAVEVPAKDAGVAGAHNLNGTKTVELLDPISPTIPTSIVDDQLPSLLSMAIDGLPRLQQSRYAHEAEKCLEEYVKRYHNVKLLEPICRAAFSAASYMHPAAISVDRLVAISISYSLQFLLDDIFFDIPDEFREDEYGISQSACGGPQNIQEYLDHLDELFSQQVQPRNPCHMLETMVWESGRDMLALSNPEWFNRYVARVVEHHRGSAASHADIVQGKNVCLQDLEAYTIMRVQNVGADFVQLAIEFVNDCYLPSILTETQYLEDVTMAASTHVGFVNDIFSYHKEAAIEQNPRNLITVLMECEGKPFAQTVHMAIDLVNTYARVIMDLETQASNSTWRKHLKDVKALIVGNIYYCFVHKRYRHPESFFPELRDMTSGWEILPRAKDLGL